MMRGVDNATLADRYLVTEMFRPDAVSLTYSHVERFVVGGAMPVTAPVALPAQDGGAPFLERREVGVVNVGGAGRVTVDGAEVLAWDVGAEPWTGWHEIPLGDQAKKIRIEILAIRPDPGAAWGDAAATRLELVERR